jgi:hypothetical protein
VCPSYLHPETRVLLHSDSRLQMAPALLPASPLKLLATPLLAISHTAGSRLALLMQKSRKASGSWAAVRAATLGAVVKGLKSVRQRLQDLHGVSTHL